VEFFQADDDGTIPASLIIALIVTHPAEQLKLLRQLFSQLQDSAFCESLLTVPEEQLSTLFKKHIFISSPEKQSAACT
jgi:galactitol PTS system EIIA component